MFRPQKADSQFKDNSLLREPRCCTFEFDINLRQWHAGQALRVPEGRSTHLNLDTQGSQRLLLDYAMQSLDSAWHCRANDRVRAIAEE